MIQILGECRVTFDRLIGCLLGIEGIYFLIEAIAFIVYLLQLFVCGFGVVSLFINSRELAFDSGKVLAHVENGQIVSDEGEPFFVLFVLLLDDIIADGFKSVVFDVEQVIS